MSLSVTSMDVETGTKGLLAGAFGPAAAKLDMDPIQLKQGINNENSYQVAQNYPDGSHSRIGYHPGNGKVFPQASGANGGGLMVDVASDRDGVIRSHGILQIGPPGLGR